MFQNSLGMDPQNLRYPSLAAFRDQHVTVKTIAIGRSVRHGESRRVGNRLAPLLTMVACGAEEVPSNDNGFGLARLATEIARWNNTADPLGGAL